MARLRPPVVAYVRRKRGELRRVLKDEAARLEERMKAEARWTDESGGARAALFCRVESAGAGRDRLVLGYDPATLAAVNKEWNGRYFYPIALESHNEGRFAIVQPTADRLRGELGRRVRERLRVA